MNTITPVEFKLKTVENQSDRYYLYGDLDGLLGTEPNQEFWYQFPEYKKGYLDGIVRRIENKFNGLKAA